MAAYPLPTMGLRWNEKTGFVTRAFKDWMLTDREIRAFLSSSSEFIQEGYKRFADELPSSPDELYEQGVPPWDYGEWPPEQEWMLLSSVVKDAVTAFEVYMEKAADGVLEQYELSLTADAEQGRSPEWRELVKLFRLLGAEIETEEVRRVLALRHVLTHQRGELRTKKLREAFGNPASDPFGGPAPGPFGDGLSSTADLTQEKALDACGSLAAVVRRTDPIAYEYTRGSQKSDLLADFADMGITWKDVPRITRRPKEMGGP
jgi:hypothetical protein